MFYLLGLVTITEIEDNIVFSDNMLTSSEHDGAIGTNSLISDTNNILLPKKNQLMITYPTSFYSDIKFNIKDKNSSCINCIIDSFSISQNDQIMFNKFFWMDKNNSMSIYIKTLFHIIESLCKITLE